MSLQASEPTVRKARQKQVDVQERHEVQAAIAPVIAKIGHWQMALTMLKAKVSRGNGDPLQLVGTCRGIAQQVASGRRVVQRAIPERLRRHGRVIAIERSLAMIEFQVIDLQRDLARQSRSSAGSGLNEVHARGSR